MSDESLGPTPPPGAPGPSATVATPGTTTSQTPSLGEYLLGEQLGSGTFGKVVAGTHTSTGQLVAIKMSKPGKSLIIETQAFVAIRAEPHAHVIECVEVHTATNSLVYERGSMSLHDFLIRPGVFSSPPSHGLLEPQAQKMFSQMVAGVLHLHSRLGMAHLDLKPENWVICGPIAESHKTLKRGVKLKLIDFGLSKMLRCNHPVYGLLEPAGTFAFVAPEVFAAPAVPAAVRVAIDGTPLPGMAGVPFDGFLADVWSLGICLFVMTCGQLPFDYANLKIGTWMRPPPYKHCPCWSWVVHEISRSLASLPPNASPDWSIADLILSCYPAHGPNYMSNELRSLLTHMLMPLPERRYRLDRVAQDVWVTPFKTPKARKRPAEASSSGSGDAAAAHTAIRYQTPEPAAVYRGLSAGSEELDKEQQPRDVDIEDDSYSEEEEECCYRSLPCTLDDARDCEGRPSLPVVPLRREDAIVW